MVYDVAGFGRRKVEERGSDINIHLSFASAVRPKLCPMLELWGDAKEGVTIINCTRPRHVFRSLCFYLVKTNK